MRRCIGPAAFGLALAAATELPAQEASKFYLDYNVPESPAFAVLGVTPATVLRGTASKPLVVSLASDIAHGDRIGSGMALDVAPYAYWGRFRNVKEYQDDTWKRLWANTLLSLATVQSPADSNSTGFAVGLRATLKDDHDLLRSSNLSSLVSKRLVPRKIACPKIGNSNICQSGTSDVELEVDVSAAYDSARAEVANIRGWAAAIGGAFGGTLVGGIPRTDSLQDRVGHAWVAGTRYMGAGNELLGMAAWVRDTSGADRVRLGAAYRLQTASSSVAAELAYDSGAGGLLPGLNAELRVYRRITLVAALVTNAPTGEDDTKRIRFRTSIRWAGTEGF